MKRYDMADAMRNVIAEQREEITALKAENAKLQASNEVIAEDHAALCKDNARLRELLEEDSEQLDKWQKKAEYYSQLLQLAEAENAKLRELVRIMHSELVSCEDNGYVCGGHKFDDRVREMGIKVKK